MSDIKGITVDNISRKEWSEFAMYPSAVAGGSMFVYHRRRKAVLINYPTKEELHTIDWGD